MHKKIPAENVGRVGGAESHFRPPGPAPLFLYIYGMIIMDDSAFHMKSVCPEILRNSIFQGHADPGMRNWTRPRGNLRSSPLFGSRLARAWISSMALATGRAGQGGVRGFDASFCAAARSAAFTMWPVCLYHKWAKCSQKQTIVDTHLVESVSTRQNHPVCSYIL